jgi:phospholipase/lecithinase/hemolysin
MNTVSLKRWTLATVVGVACSIPLLAGAQTNFKRIVVFGTSLSDPGNAFALAGGVNTPPDYLQDIFMVPNAPYARGGHHLTNGATWIEQLARPMGLAGTVRPAFRGSAGATNYAVAGTRAFDDGDPSTFQLSTQVDAFLQSLGGNPVPADWLVVMEMGSNDVRDAFVAGLSDPALAGAIFTGALQSIAEDLGRLRAAGATNFLIWNSVPNIGVTPAVRALAAALEAQFGIPQAVVIGAATGTAAAFSAQLENIVAGLVLSGANVTRLDVFPMVNALVANPASFGLTNVTMPCITPNIAPFKCQKPDEYLFWDGIHPTSAVHGILGQAAAAALRP